MFLSLDYRPDQTIVMDENSTPGIPTFSFSSNIYFTINNLGSSQPARLPQGLYFQGDE